MSFIALEPSAASRSPRSKPVPADRSEVRTSGPSKTRGWRPSIDIEQVRASWNLTDRFFTALAMRDSQTVLSIYADAARIDHPIAGRMSGREAKQAWETFLKRTPEFAFSYHICHAGVASAEVEWTIRHVFFETGRAIAIDGVSTFVFEAGQIVLQRDRFSRRDWSRQALGWKGLVLSFVPGWQSFLQFQMRRVLAIDTVPTR